jgi:DNA polymerase III sliding clamp (beta) subunit (PCNA family)
MATSEYTANFTASAMTLRRLFDKSKFAISTEETRYYLNGVYMHVAEVMGDKSCAVSQQMVTDWRGSMRICQQKLAICLA